jgi:SET domain-containing protein
MNLVFYMNHSKNPNMSLKNSGNGVTLRAIRKGEELTFDYDANFGEEHTL